MRHSSLCMVLVGALPLVSFAATVWLTDGAPFEPYDARPFGAVAPHDCGASKPLPPASPVAVVPDIQAASAGPSDRALLADVGDPEWDRLRHRAARGDAEAALLLAILEPPRRHTSRLTDAQGPAMVPAAIVSIVSDP